MDSSIRQPSSRHTPCHTSVHEFITYKEGDFTIIRANDNYLKYCEHSKGEHTLQSEQKCTPVIIASQSVSDLKTGHIMSKDPGGTKLLGHQKIITSHCTACLALYQQRMMHK